MIGKQIAGVQIDEDGFLYFTTMRTRLVDGRPFLQGRSGIFGVKEKMDDAGIFKGAYTGTYCKSGGKETVFLQEGTPVPLEEKPGRAPELRGGYGESGQVWVEGVQWLYAGASPVTPFNCTCPTQRPHLDWYKRSFVPEAYRHSIGVLDANGNLVMHIGRYGNFDSASGPQSAVPVGGDGIAMSMVRFVSGTDNYLCFEDNGECLSVLKLNYHAEETVGLK